MKSIEPDARVTIQAAPANDPFASPAAISGASGTIAGTTVNATREAGEPTPLSAWGTKGKSIWYSWTAPASGTAVFTTQGSIKSGSNSTAMDTLLAVYTGSSLNALTVKGANDDASSNAVWSQVSVSVTAGTTYRIVVDGYNNTSGATKLNWSFAASVPANDNFANRQVISGASGSVTGSTVNATHESGEPDHGSGSAHSIWYRWQAPSTGSVTVSLAGSDFATLQDVYTGSAVNALTRVTPTAQSLDSVTFNATSGQTYAIAVDGRSGASGTVAMAWMTNVPTSTVPDAPTWAAAPDDAVVSGRSVTAHLVAPANNGGAPVTSYTVVCSTNGGFVSNTSTTTTVQLDSLTGGASYTCNAYATNIKGTSVARALSHSVVMPSVPGAPTAVAGSGKDRSAVVTWTAPGEDPRAPITGYTVTSSGSPTRQCTTSGETTCTVTGLTNGVAYTFTVRATNVVGVGVASAPSAAITPRAPTLDPPADTTPAPPAPADPGTPDTPPDPSTITGPGLPQSREALSWGIDRLDQRALPLDGRFGAMLDGTGVTAYVVDTGVMADHSEFTGRVIDGVDEVADGNGTADCNGHGTHVAGTIAGAGYGVAPMARVSPVRVLGCDGSGSVSDVIAGLDWIVRAHGANQPAVANLSMGTPSSAALNAAVDRAVADGVTVTVAAGNEAGNACDMSPANDASVITVGAVDDTDTRASFSDYGSCLSVFAPGVDIDSAWNTGTKDIETLSGTSMAAPHAAGVAALLLSGTPSASPAQVKQAITEGATTGAVHDAGPGSPNLLLFGALSGVPTSAASGSNSQGQQQIARPKAPKVRKLARDARGRLVITLTAAKGAKVKVYAGGKLVKTSTAPKTGKAFRIVVTRTVAKGVKITLKAVNAGGTSPASKAVKAP